MIIKARGSIYTAMPPIGTKACPFCRHREGLVPRYIMLPKPEQAAYVFIQCGDDDKRTPGCGARGPWRLNPIVLKKPDDQGEVLAYFENMAKVAWSDWNKQGDG